MAPDTAGDYELRYLTGQTISLLARTPITVTPVTASVSGPATIEARNATPAEPGEYEYRYMTGQTNQVLVGPLDRSAAAKVASINAMNLAKTPIAATLANAGAGLAGRPGPHLIILLTGVVNGPAVELLPGSYGVRAATSEGRIPASVVADEESIVSMEPE
jgi:hypothetical protein